MSPSQSLSASSQTSVAEVLMAASVSSQSLPLWSSLSVPSPSAS
jgi:hypothetical protein